MSELEHEVTRKELRKRRAPRKRAPLSVVNIFGELFLLAGLGILGFILWQPWYSQVVVGGEAKQLAADFASELKAQSQEAAPAPAAPGVVPISKAKGIGVPYAIVYIPALGDDYSYLVADGIGRPTPLDDKRTGIGHYPESPAFGENGNIAIAAHRNGPLAPFRNVEYLRTGDKIYVETLAGWYTYSYRNSEIVMPTQVSVLHPFPHVNTAQVTESLLTLTSCYPKDGDAARVINYSTFESFRSRADGPPPELAKVNKNVGQKKV